jgi:hypothetical protein
VSSGGVETTTGPTAGFVQLHHLPGHLPASIDQQPGFDPTLKTNQIFLLSLLKKNVVWDSFFLLR